MLEYILYIFVTALVGVITWFVLYARKFYGSLEELEHIFPVIKPSFILGSMVDMYKLVIHEEDVKNHKKYGPIFGMYEGRSPFVFISDPELIRLIFIKDFDHFSEKRKFDALDPLIAEMMDVLPGEKWKTVRSFLSPTFTTGKIKHMSNMMIEAIEDCVGNLDKKVLKSKTVTVKEIFNALTIDVIARCVFGMKLNSLEDPNNEFVKNMVKLNPTDMDMNIGLTVAMTYQFMFRFLSIFPHDVLKYFRDIIKSVAEKRRRDNVQVNDFVDSLNEMIKLLDTEEYKRLGISENTAYAQAMVFLLAGFDTSATTLSMLSYRLATNPEAQARVVAELDQHLHENDGQITYDGIRQLEYLSAAVQETLRMCPPLIRLERECQKDWAHEPSGLVIKKGMTVQVSAWEVHYDSKNYPDPEEFKPERFLAKNKESLNPYAFLSFGQGPHNCIGMRFALEEIKLAMARILKEYTLEPCSETKLKFKKGRNFLVQFDPIKVNFIKRK